MPSSVSSWLKDMAGTPVPVLLLVAIAGGTDALIMLHSKELLAVYMTGNSTRLGQSLLAGAWDRTLPLLCVVASFFSSATLAAWLGARLPAWRASICLAMTALLLACALPYAGGNYAPAVTCLIASGIGAINQVRADEFGVSFITGTLIRVTRHIAEGRFGAAATGMARWMALVVGAALGSLLDFLYGSGALAILASAAAVGALLAVLARGARHACSD
jgi:uncharacterized membrane protein YoaK (UPF0700 family)